MSGASAGVIHLKSASMTSRVAATPVRRGTTLLHEKDDCREHLRQKRYVLLMMQHLWTGVLCPYLDTLPANTLTRKIVERDFSLLTSLVECAPVECDC
jgi:hypothetical protein